MDKTNMLEPTVGNSIVINERKSIVVTGVTKIDRFDDEEFLVTTTLGVIVIKGTELEIMKLDTYQGNVSIKGHIISLVYIEENIKNKRDNSVFSRLFK